MEAIVLDYLLSCTAGGCLCWVFVGFWVIYLLVMTFLLVWNGGEAEDMWMAPLAAAALALVTLGIRLLSLSLALSFMGGVLGAVPASIVSSLLFGRY